MNTSTSLLRFSRSLLLLAAVAFGFAACGDDDDPVPPPAGGGTPGAGGGFDNTPPQPPPGPPGGGATQTPAPGGSDSTSDTGSAPGSGDPDGPTLAALHAEVFQSNCMVCHGISALGGLDMRLDAGLRNRLLDPSLQVPALPLVDPGNPETSYLWHKVANTHEDVGGFGDPMPPTGLLGAADLDRIEAWIRAGAPQ